MSEARINISHPSTKRTDAEMGSSFYLEVIIIVLVILLASIVLTSFLAKARSASLDAQRTTDATIVASSVAEMYSASADDAAFDTALAAASDTVGEAQVVVTPTKKETGTGTMSTAHITVSYGGKVYSSVDVERYTSTRGEA